MWDHSACSWSHYEEIRKLLSEWQRLVYVFQSLPVYNEGRVVILNLADNLRQH